MKDRAKAMIALDRAVLYGNMLSCATHPDDKAYYEPVFRRCLKAAAEHAGFRVFEAGDSEQEKAA